MTMIKEENVTQKEAISFFFFFFDKTYLWTKIVKY